MGKHFYVETYRLCIWPQPHPFPFASEIEVTGTPGDLSGRDLPCGSNVLTGLAAARDKLVSIRSIAMITSEIKQPTWPCLSIPQTASFRVLIMSVRAEMSPLRGNFHFDDVSSICLKFFFLVPFFFLAALLLGLQKLSLQVTHSSILLCLLSLNISMVSKSTI